MGPLEHKDHGALSDEALADEAKKFLAASPARQLVAELLQRLRATPPAWWSPESLRAKWSAAERMSWLASRPDLRQKITSRLTGLAPKAARKKSPEFQAGLIDSVVDEGDVDAKELDQAFAAEDLAVYGPAESFWRAFLEALPIDAKDKDTDELAGFVLEALLAGVSGLPGGFSRAPILTPLDVRLAIDGTLWQTKLPIEIRVAIDRARLAHEREQREPRFGAADEFAFATPAVLATTFTLRELAPIFVAGERAMGFGREAGRAEPPPLQTPPTRSGGSTTHATPAPSARSGISPAAASTSSTPSASTPPASAIGTPSASPLTAAMMSASNRGRGSIMPAPPPTMPSAPPPAPPPGSGAGPSPSSAPRSMSASSPPGAATSGPASRSAPISTPGMVPVPPPLQARGSSPPIALPPPPSGSPSSRKAASVVPPPPPPPPPHDEFAEVLENELEPATNPWEPEGRDTPQDEPPNLGLSGKSPRR